MRRVTLFPVLLALLAADILLTCVCLCVMLARRALSALGMLILERQFDIVRASLALSAWVGATDDKAAA